MHKRYQFHHVFQSPNVKRSKRPPRFAQQIVNNFVGDDGPVTPVLNVHMEVKPPIESSYDRDRLRELRDRVLDLKHREALDYATKETALQQETDVVNGIITIAQDEVADWANTARTKPYEKR